MYLPTPPTEGSLALSLYNSAIDRLCLNISCCVDEVAAQHVDADALVHYGHACMSQCVSGAMVVQSTSLTRSLKNIASASDIRLRQEILRHSSWRVSVHRHLELELDPYRQTNDRAQIRCRICTSDW